MKDIETFIDGGRVKDTDIWKASNLLSTNIGSLYYLPAFGIDMDMFFSQDYNVQFESFRAYVTNTMVQNGINITKLGANIETFLNEMLITIGGYNNGL